MTLTDKSKLPEENAAIKEKVASYYSAKLTEHGMVPKGVDWNDETTQNVRFEQLLKIVESSEASILDYGCGYGALASYLRTTGWQGKFVGFDWSEAMIASAKNLYSKEKNLSFFQRAEDLSACDYAVASGIFNVKLESSDREWLKHILNTLDHLDRLSSKGFAFNVLTNYSDADRMRRDLYYANPSFILEFCLRRYSRHVAILHDYNLFEFTVLVKKTAETK